MAEDPFDPMTSAGGRNAARSTPLDAGAETAGIKREIARTRYEMRETLGEIQERLRPNHLIQQAKDTVADAATGKVRSIMESASVTATNMADQTRYAGRSIAGYARTHPLQMALLAGGVTWLCLRARRDSEDWAGVVEDWENEGGAATVDGSIGEPVAGYEASARGTIGEYAASARQAVGDAAHSAREAVQEASSRVTATARQASRSAREGWQRASTSVDTWVHENPFAAGAVAVAVGAAVGLCVPATRFEDRAMGGRRDHVMARARAAARDMRDTVTEEVEKAADAVLDVAATKTAATPPARPSSDRVS